MSGIVYFRIRYDDEDGGAWTFGEPVAGLFDESFGRVSTEFPDLIVLRYSNTP